MSTYIPPQHGAWAFLGLPIVLGLTVSPWSWAVLPLAVAWVAAYPWSYAAFGLVRARRPGRFRRPFLVWSAVLLTSGALLLAVRPWLLWWSPFFLLAFVVNLLYARRNDERALVNDLVLVVECAAMVVVTWGVCVSGRTWTPPSLADLPVHVLVLAVVCALVLTGSTLHVKSLIRERRDPRYARASRVFAVGCLLASPLLAAWWGLPAGWWLVLPFAWLAVRAFLVGRRPMKASAVGLLELVGLVCAALVALPAAA